MTTLKIGKSIHSGYLPEQRFILVNSICIVECPEKGLRLHTIRLTPSATCAMDITLKFPFSGRQSALSNSQNAPSRALGRS